MKKLLVILSMLWGLQSTLLANQDPVGTISAYGGTYNDVKVVGNYAYVTNNYLGLQIIDISTLTTPTLVGVIGINGMSNSVTVVGDYAYVTNYLHVPDEHTGLQIINISNPASPTLTSNINLDGYVDKVTVVGDYAYVANGDAGLQIIDISTPESPALVATLDTSDYALGVTVVEDYAYVADANAGLQIIDISTPISPVLVATFNTSGRASDVFIKGDYAYVADGTSGLQIIDISTPTSPSLVGTIHFDGYASNIAVSGNYVYVADGFLGVRIIDNSNPVSPVFITNLQTNNSLHGIEIIGDYAYIASYDGLSIIKIKDIDNDGVLESEDAFPLDPTESIDTDNDGIGNNADTDDDNDGILDADEIANGLNPLDASDATQDADGDGISNAVEIANGTDPLTLTQIEQFVKRFYQVILGRSLDAAGLQYWSSSLEGLSKAGADIAKGFIFSDEYNIDSKANTQYLTTLYNAFFNREPDTEGFNHWMELLNAGTSREEVLDGFLNSQEFKHLSDSYGIISNATPVELFVSRFYKQTLGRLPDEAGLADWTSKLNSGELSGADVAFGFIFSKEFSSKNLNNTDFIYVLYRAFFGRDPNNAEFNSLKVVLDAKSTIREEIVQGFISSPEFANLADSYGIRAY